MSRSRSKKKMRKLQEVQDFCEQEYGEEIELTYITPIICECGDPMQLLMEFETHKLYICMDNKCNKRRKV